MNFLQTNNTYQCFDSLPDFFGIIDEPKIETKKTMILEIYKFVFRFSISKLIANIEDELFLTIFFQYIKETKMQRIHQRQVLNKNASAYYRALENIVNHSGKCAKLTELLKSKTMEQDPKSFSFSNNHISLDKLYKFNTFLNLAIIDDEKSVEDSDA